jgi:Domain of unknown function (DUF4365)
MSQRESGGKMPVNLRQGIRAEHLAQYILSEFGPCTWVTHENDYGIDLICSLMTESGSVGSVTSVFGVQVKSGDEPFTFRGQYLWKWLKHLNFPLFFARVDRKTVSLKLYSAWTLALKMHWENGGFVNDILRFVPDDAIVSRLKDPEDTPTETIVYMGKPIIHVDAMRLSESEFRGKVFRILDEWVSFEVENYARRLAGIPVTYGYQKWETNESLETSERGWYLAYVHGGVCLEKARDAFLHSATVMGLSWKDSDTGSYDDLKSYLAKSGLSMSDYTKSVFHIDPSAGK